MTKDDIIRMAHESKVFIPRGSQEEVAIQELERFAAMVAAAEREACAKVCDSLVDRVEAEKAKLRIDYARMEGDEEDELRAMRHELTVSTFNAGISKCAAVIRARSNK